MAQTHAFETDFWKDANLRKLWDDIVPGEPRKTIPYTLTREAIALYCKSVGEDHPVYFDEAYARTTRYGGLIAPPSIHILLMFSCTQADDWMRSPGTVNAGQSWSYNVPARPGDVITLQARALDKFIKRERLFVPRSRQVHQAITAVRGARQCFLQPARRGDLFGPWLDHPAAVRDAIMTATFDSLAAGDIIDGPKFAVSRESIRLFCDASLDYNPLHLDDDYMRGNFGRTNFGGVIMHGMNNFGLISRMITDWAYPAGAVHRRLETRWVKPVRPGDTIQPTGIVKSKQATANSRWVLIDVMVRNQNDEKVATGEAMVEFPPP
jgi:3-hydroxybutyryl-CoA dehydratase